MSPHSDLVAGSSLRVWTRSAPEGDDGGQSEGRGVVAGELVVAGGDLAKVLEAVEGRLDPPALPIAGPVMADLPLDPPSASRTPLIRSC